jgi:hypothetical protein
VEELMISMQDIKTLALIVFWVYFVLLMLGIALSHTLFKSLKKNHVVYYKSIGEPIAISPINLTEDNFVQTLAQLQKSVTFIYSTIFKGIPKNFPKDTSLRKLVQAIRITLAVTLVLFITLVGVGYLFYKSTS